MEFKLLLQENEVAELGTVCEPTEKRIIDGLIENAVLLNDSLQGAVGRLQTISDRLIGAVSEDKGASTGKTPEPVRNELDELLHQFKLLRAQIDNCNAVVEELSKI